MKRMPKSSPDDTSTDSNNIIFLFTFWQNILYEPTASTSGSLIYIRPLPSAGVLARG